MDGLSSDSTRSYAEPTPGWRRINGAGSASAFGRQAGDRWRSRESAARSITGSRGSSAESGLPTACLAAGAANCGAMAG